MQSGMLSLLHWMITKIMVMKKQTLLIAFKQKSPQFTNWLTEIMTNPYVENLIEMGYDRSDCETVAVAGVDKTFPLNIHGRVYQTQEEYDAALHDFLNGMWFTMRLFFVSLFIILGANLGINLLDSNMSEIINERRETLENYQQQNAR